MYRQPDNTVAAVDEFLNNLKQFINYNNNKNILIIGDFNFNILNKYNDNNVNKYVELIQSNNFYFCDHITITRPSSNSILDHISSQKTSRSYTQ